MFTRCPGCQAVFELDARVLAEAAGVVRCGNCGKTFNTLSHLYADHPEDAAEPIRGGGMPPLLEHPELVQTELPVQVSDAPELEPWYSNDEPEAEIAEPRPIPAVVWPVTSAVLLLLLVIQTWMLWQTPSSPLTSWITGGAGDFQANPNEAVQIVSRDMHRHPSLDDAIVVSASLRNQERFAIDFPILEIQFYDPSQQVLGARRLQPDEYLHDTQMIRQGMPPGTVIPLLLEFVVGTTEPTGFQIRFYPVS